MTGAILTFVVVCVIVAIYMSITHAFLRSAEEPEDRRRDEEERNRRRRESPVANSPRRGPSFKPAVSGERGR
jgi:hypothetical protein